MATIPVREVSLGFTAERFPVGTHICYIYNDDAERRAIMAEFVRSGLQAGEKVTYLVEEVSPHVLREHFAELGIPLPNADHQEQLEICEATPTYCPDGSFVPDRMLDRLRLVHTESERLGMSGARITGEMKWALRGLPGSERLTEYEARINMLVVDCPLTVICQYDANRFDGATLFRVLCSHPMMIVHGQVVRNPYYLAPDRYFARYPAAQA